MNRNAICSDRVAKTKNFGLPYCLEIRRAACLTDTSSPASAQYWAMMTKTRLPPCVVDKLSSSELVYHYIRMTSRFSPSQLTVVNRKALGSSIIVCVLRISQVHPMRDDSHLGTVRRSSKIDMINPSLSAMARRSLPRCASSIFRASRRDVGRDVMPGSGSLDASETFRRPVMADSRMGYLIFHQLGAFVKCQFTMSSSIFPTSLA